MPPRFLAIAMIIPDTRTYLLVGSVLAVLAAATAVGQVLKRRLDAGLNPAIVEQFHLRVRTWWLMCTVLAAAFIVGREITVILFGLISFWSLREFITLTPTRPGDHRALFWVFFVITPLQYVLVGLEEYSLYSILIPVFGFLFITARVSFSGDPKRFLERTAKIMAGLMICVYCLSFAPALLSLPPKGKPIDENARLLFFFVLVVQFADIAHYLWGKLLGKRLIAPEVSAGRTWEGFLGGIASATLFGTVLWWSVPLTAWQAACLSALTATAGMAGGMTMSAIKRDRGVKDYGTLVVGHGGVLDRIDSICFAAPVFYYAVRVMLDQWPAG